MRSGRLVLLVVLGAVAVGFAATGSAATNRSYNQSTTLLRLDGVAAEPPKSVSMTDTVTASGTTSEGKIAFLPTPAGAFTKWIDATLKGSSSAKSLDVVTVDYSFKEKSVETLARATIAEIDFPAVDAISKEVLYWTVSLAPAASTTKAGDGSAQQGAGAIAKHALASSFKLTIDGVDTSYVIKVDAVSVKITAGPAARSGPTGAESFRRPVVAAAAAAATTAKQTVSPLRITMPTAHATGFQQWVGSRAAKNVTVTYLQQNLVDTLCTLTFSGVVPATLSSTMTANSDTIQKSTLTAQPASVQISCP